jgi:hypothetical protein
VFYMTVGAGRQGVATLTDALQRAGFSVDAREAPASLRENPLVSGDDAELELHFNELITTESYTLYTVRRSQDDAVSSE